MLFKNQPFKKYYRKILSVTNCLQRLSAENTCRQRGKAGLYAGELRLSGNSTVTEYEMSGEPYSQKSGWIKHSSEGIFQVMIFK